MSSNHFQSDSPLIHRAQMWQFRRLSQERLGHIYCRFRIIRGAAIVFSRMRSKGSRFTLGVWGLRVCSLDVASASATVRNRSCEDRMAVPMGSSAEVVIFGGFRRVVASFRVAGVALCDIQTCFATC